VNKQYKINIGGLNMDKEKVLFICALCGKEYDNVLSRAN
jgi:hypothetical protein